MCRQIKRDNSRIKLIDASAARGRLVFQDDVRGLPVVSIGDFIGYDSRVSDHSPALKAFQVTSIDIYNVIAVGLFGFSIVERQRKGTLVGALAGCSAVFSRHILVEDQRIIGCRGKGSVVAQSPDQAHSRGKEQNN